MKMKMICVRVGLGLVKWGWFLVHSTIILNGTIINLSIMVGKMEVIVMENWGFGNRATWSTKVRRVVVFYFILLSVIRVILLMKKEGKIQNVHDDEQRKAETANK